MEIRSKKLVQTRKTHECFGCGGGIGIGEHVVVVTAVLDERHTRFHVHCVCNIDIMTKHDGEYRKGVINETPVQKMAVGEMDDLPF